MNNRSKVTRLNRADQRKVEDYLKEHWAEITAERLAKDTICGRIAAELKIVTTAHVLDACAKAVELGMWPRPLHNKTTGAHTFRTMIRLLCLWAEQAGKEYQVPIPKEIADFNELTRQASKAPKQP